MWTGRTRGRRITLPLETELLSIKKNNNTYTHTGEMASWQMRGVLVPKKVLPRSVHREWTVYFFCVRTQYMY